MRMLLLLLLMENGSSLNAKVIPVTAVIGSSECAAFLRKHDDNMAESGPEFSATGPLEESVRRNCPEFEICHPTMTQLFIWIPR